MLPVTDVSRIIDILIITTIASYLAGRKLKKYTGFVTASGLIVVTLILLKFIPEVLEAEIYEECALLSVFPLGFSLRIDGLSLTLALIVNFISTLSSIYSIQWIRGKNGHEIYFSLLSFLAFTMTIVVFTSDLIILFLFWELTVTIPVFLIAKWGYENRLTTAIRFFLFSRFGGVLLLVGLILAYTSLGSSDMYVLANVNHHLEPEIATLIILLMILGFSVKMAIWPFHGWLPSAYVDAPIPVTVLLSGVMSKLGVYGVIRVLQIFHGVEFPEIQSILTFLALITALYGGVMALKKNELREILAFSSMSHMGYILFGFSALSIHGHGFSGALLHMINHTISKSILFFCAGFMLQIFKTDDVRELRGEFGRHRLLLISAVVGALGLMGLPPTIGFWSKDMLLGFSLELGYPATILMFTVAFLSVAYNLRWITYASTGVKSDEPEKHSIAAITPVILLVALAIAPLIYMDSLTHLLKVEHAIVEPIPLLMSILALTCGFIAVYTTVCKRWVQIEWLTSPSTVLLNAISLEWLYIRFFVSGLMKAANWIFNYIETSIDGFNYLLANGLMKAANWIFNYIETSIDGFNYLLARGAFHLSQYVRRIQTGMLPYNVLGMVLALIILLLLILLI
ncbi:NADH-quinone oxidoreductase subunit M [Candidatus Bathyarchaeota archaeon]|nr:NADH-quinone oxidoreductase subunit M [Candidatus Bathyarchaeota archaeon]MBS7612823.1 NADH-quinone oxidoreductase subunit M [Candidatus Bathyarchaeota archaeon]MBS7617157.1 NADH-quinone oxidoreductase subunit M [Candidatus Bathyarchaeota archaeon]